MQSVIPKVRDVRVEKGFTQNDLAQKCGMTQASICRKEQGKQRLLVSDIYKLADALGCRPEELYEVIE